MFHATMNTNLEEGQRHFHTFCDVQIYVNPGLATVRHVLNDRRLGLQMSSNFLHIFFTHAVDHFCRFSIVLRIPSNADFLMIYTCFYLMFILGLNILGRHFIVCF